MPLPSVAARSGGSSGGDPTRRSNASWRERDQAARTALIAIDRRSRAAIALAAYPHHTGAVP